jgi:predicted methyltransferase
MSIFRRLSPLVPAAGLSAATRAAGFRAAMAATALILLAAAIACGGAATDEAAETAAPAGAPASEPISYDPAILDEPGRTEDDHYRDGGTKPLELYAFFGVEPGMTVGDLATARMYNAHVLGQIVGDEGTVYAIVTYRDTVTDRAVQGAQETFAARNVAGGMANVEIVGTLEDLPDESLDVLITVRNYHDFGERAERLATIPRLLRVLKPGGILGAVDAHTDKTDERDESVHRLNEDLARQELIEGGFELVASSDLLYNPDDTFDFDGREGLETPDDPSDDAPIHRYFIHRWALKMRKPMN